MLEGRFFWRLRGLGCLRPSPLAPDPALSSFFAELELVGLLVVEERREDGFCFFSVAGTEASPLLSLMGVNGVTRGRKKPKLLRCPFGMSTGPAIGKCHELDYQ